MYDNDIDKMIDAKVKEFEKKQASNPKKSKKKNDSKDAKNKDKNASKDGNNTDNNGKQKLDIMRLQEDIEKDYLEKIEVEVEYDEQQYVVLIDKKFRPSKVSEFFVELANVVQNYVKHDIEVDDLSYNYFVLLLLKKFTDMIPDDVWNKCSIEQKFSMLNSLMDSEILFQVLDKFPEGEIEKVTNRAMEYSQNMDEFNFDLASKVASGSLKIENDNILNLNKWAKDILKAGNVEGLKLNEEMEKKRQMAIKKLEALGNVGSDVDAEGKGEQDKDI